MRWIFLLLVLLPTRVFGFDCSACTFGCECSGDRELNRPFCDHSNNVCTYPTASNTAGTGTISSSGSAITGSGTDFVNQINPGWILQAGGQTDVVFSITDATHLSLTNGFAPDVSAVAYTVRPPIARWMDVNQNPILTFQGDGHVTIGPGTSRALLDVEPVADPPSVSSGNGIDATNGFVFETQFGGATTDSAGTGGTGAGGTIFLSQGGNAPLTPGHGGSLLIHGSPGGQATNAGGTGGLGGPITIQAGEGGNGASGGTNGTGNDLILRGGAKGSDAGASGGSPGNVKIADQGGNVKFGQTATPSAAFQFVNTNGTVTSLERGTATTNVALALPSALPGANGSMMVGTTGGVLSFGAVPNTAGACSAGQYETADNAGAVPTCAAASGVGACSAGQAATTLNAGAAPTCTAFTTGSSTDTFTNKTLDVEGTGNTVTTVSKFWIPAASCNNATPAPNLDLPTSAAPTAACVTGTNIQKGVLQYADGADSSGQVSLFLPDDWSGTVDAKVLFTSADVTNGHTEKWTIATSCRTPTGGTGATDDRAFNTAQTMTYTNGASEVASALRNVTQTTVTMTNCVAGDLWHVKIGRDTTDTDTGTMNLVGLSLTLRRAQ